MMTVSTNHTSACDCFHTRYLKIHLYLRIKIEHMLYNKDPINVNCSHEMSVTVIIKNI